MYRSIIKLKLIIITYFLFFPHFTTVLELTCELIQKKEQLYYIAAKRLEGLFAIKNQKAIEIKRQILSSLSLLISEAV